MPTIRMDSFAGGPWVFDGRAHEVRHSGTLKKTSEIEFSVLHQLLDRTNQVVIREEFRAWNKKPVNGERHPVDNVIVFLRRLLKPDFEIETAWGRGYRLKSNFLIKRIASPSSSATNTLGEIASDRMKMHSARSLQVSVRHYEEMLKGGPDEVAYCELVKALINLGSVGLSVQFPHDTVAQVRAVLSDALDYYPDSAPALALRGLSHAIYDFNWGRAYEDVRKAINIDPKSAWGYLFLGHLDVANGQFESGITAARMGAELDPTTPMSSFTVPMLLHLCGREEEAASEAARLLDLFEPFPIGNSIYGSALSALGSYGSAIREFEKSLKSDFLPGSVARLGHTYGMIGEKDKAYSCLQRLHDAEAHGAIAFVSGYFEALIRVSRSEFDEALNCLERAHTQRCDWLIHLNAEPCWKPIRGNERFKTLLQNVGL